VCASRATTHHRPDNTNDPAGANRRQFCPFTVPIARGEALTRSPPVSDGIAVRVSIAIAGRVCRRGAPPG